MSEVREVQTWLSLTFGSNHTSWAYHTDGVSVAEGGHCESGADFGSVLRQLRSTPDAIVVCDGDVGSYHLIDVDLRDESVHLAILQRGGRLTVTELDDGRTRLEVV